MLAGTKGRPSVSGTVILCLMALAAFQPPGHAEDRDPILFVGSADYPPFQWLDETGQAQGFVIELQDALAENGGRGSRHELMDWDDALTAVKEGDADAVALFRSERRDEVFDFTEPFYYVAHGIFAHRDGDSFGRPEDLAGRRVAAVAGAYAEQRLLRQVVGVILIPVRTELDCVEAVHAGRVEACIEAGHTARRHVAELGLHVRQTSPPFWPRAYVFGVREGNEPLRDWLNEQLALAQVDGTYRALLNTWLSELEWQERTLADTFRWLAWILVPVVAIAIGGYAWSLSLRRLVGRRTRRLRRELERRQDLQRRLRYQLGHDGLTRLPNRSNFTARLGRRLNVGAQPVRSVVLIRLVNLEQLIDAFGYSVGHELVAAFGARLQALHPELSAHFGSGLFAIASPRSLEAKAVMDAITAPVKLSQMEMDPQIILGIVHCAGEGRGRSGAEEIIRRARTALATAQQRGQRWIDYSPQLEPDTDDLRLLQDFNRHGTRDMFLLYQPKVDLATGTIDGAEALVRWQHPDLGLVSPARFIPLLESAGLIHELTRWVLAEAIAMAKRCQADRGCTVSINLAAQDLLEADVFGYISTVGQGLEPRRLRLEITETGFIKDPDQARNTLYALRDAGIGCAVDDFGTGYSSLSYLSEFPVDEVKLDRLFVGDMVHNKRHSLIIQSTIELAHKLDLSVTAEGVEDIATLELLQSMGCDAIQGFLISPAIPEDQLCKMLGEHWQSATAGNGANA